MFIILHGQTIKLITCIHVQCKLGIETEQPENIRSETSATWIQQTVTNPNVYQRKGISSGIQRDKDYTVSIHERQVTQE